jgi:(E)-4-hydroxy-3-methylbut-2-enyl-diphosphate synthase
LDEQVRSAELQRLGSDYQGQMVELMVRKLGDYIDIFEQAGFDSLVLSAKSSDPRIMIDSCQAISERFDYPLHLGLTHAGPPETGRIRSIAALGALLSRGIGDTIRISYAADPVEEVTDGKELLCCLGLRERTEPELIACPTCGRVEVDMLDLVQRVRQRLRGISVPLKVAVMGCVVNGPGEAEGADVAVFAGRGKGVICVQGQRVCTVSESDMLDSLYRECEVLADRVRRGEVELSTGVRFNASDAGTGDTQV